MGPSKAPWSEEVSLQTLKTSEKPRIITISHQGSQDQMQITLKTFERKVDGVSQQIVILLPLVSVRTHLPASLLLEITPLEQVSEDWALFTR